jgi:hypothetical protein
MGWEEDKHPRGHGGKFAHEAGAGGAAKDAMKVTSRRRNGDTTAAKVPGPGQATAMDREKMRPAFVADAKTGEHVSFDIPASDGGMHRHEGKVAHIETVTNGRSPKTVIKLQGSDHEHQVSPNLHAWTSKDRPPAVPGFAGSVFADPGKDHGPGGGRTVDTSAAKGTEEKRPFVQPGDAQIGLRVEHHKFGKGTIVSGGQTGLSSVKFDEGIHKNNPVVMDTAFLRHGSDADGPGTGVDVGGKHYPYTVKGGGGPVKVDPRYVKGTGVDANAPHVPLQSSGDWTTDRAKTAKVRAMKAGDRIEHPTHGAGTIIKMQEHAGTGRPNGWAGVKYDSGTTKSTRLADATPLAATTGGGNTGSASTDPARVRAAIKDGDSITVGNHQYDVRPHSSGGYSVQATPKNATMRSQIQRLGIAANTHEAAKAIDAHADAHAAPGKPTGVRDKTERVISRDKPGGPVKDTASGGGAADRIKAGQGAGAAMAFGGREPLTKQTVAHDMKVQHISGRTGTVVDTGNRHSGLVKVKYGDGSVNSEYLGELTRDTGTAVTAGPGQHADALLKDPSGIDTLVKSMNADQARAVYAAVSAKIEAMPKQQRDSATTAVLRPLGAAVRAKKK